MRRIMLAVLVAAAVTPAVAGTLPMRTEPTLLERLERLQPVPAAGGCKSVSSCEEAVRLWCGGYSRADADHDGIPCENVCRSKAQVDKIKAEIGC